MHKTIYKLYYYINSKHEKFLEEHCRICGNRLRGTKYRVTNYEDVVKLYAIDVSSDDSTIHPQFFCNSCYITAKTAFSKHPGDPIKREQYEWLPHDENCSICATKKGRPKKKSFGGRPSVLEQHIRSISCAMPSTTVQVLDVLYKEDVCCVVCKSDIVVKAVEIQPCKLLACQSCCIELVASKQPFSCPGCSLMHDCSVTTFSPVSSIVKKIICDLLVKCEKCKKTIKLVSLSDECATHQSQNPNVTLEDIIQQPLDAEPTGLEKRAATNLITRLLHQKGDGSISLPRRGKVCCNSNSYTLIYHNFM